MSSAVIEVKNLTKKYRRAEALRGVSFEVQRGEIFGILGPNGAGKTTTLEIIETLKEQTGGECTVLGFDTRKRASEIKRRIGVQLQSSEYLTQLTLSELLRLFASFYGIKHIDAEAVLKKVGLEAKSEAHVKELSGGQKQRFTIATALVHKPEILFLDEPTTGLDPRARRNLWSLIKQLHAENMTIVLTTHYMEEAEYLCTRVAIMDQGKILRIDAPHKLIGQLAKGYKVSFFVDQPISENLFSGLAKKTYAEYPRIVVEIEHTDALPHIMRKLQQAGVRYSFLSLQTATLEDVYLELTGREYED